MKDTLTHLAMGIISFLALFFARPTDGPGVQTDHGRDYSSAYTSSHVLNVSFFWLDRRVAFTASTVHHPVMISLHKPSLIKKLPVGQDF